MAAVSKNELMMAFEFVSGAPYGEDVNAYISLDTGYIHYVSYFGGEPEQEDVPDDIETSDRYIAIPHKNELDLGNELVFQFMERQLPDLYDKVEEIFRRKGAYSRFKNLLESKGHLEKWYAFEEASKENALREWCEDNGIEIDEDDEQSAG